ncbi:hypothetical protein TG4357_00413 [Thalassovita gelatinovora]|uniref:Bacteriophage phiJL001 Gp84 C-terminal domain-containing protein n=1 Tax=Thalassovita gelatinovora TaxID=53501 RepID=A0A0P1F592_THAGE|nr:DUF2163 domain-containing protein [Thalassovita gelatinovora]CUH62988.1 hypothetical protein TG4357_00413 [Thalassovita gelatinovora]SEQ13636.1 phage conserved hypothetical protein BR0599 [Thalassovita gelatinovora]
MRLNAEFQAHLASGATTLCRCWLLLRADGVSFGFTDHDCDLGFDGIIFKADSGLSAAALQQATGLSVDNTEAVGALSDAGVREADIEAGRFDDATVRCWLVNWADTGQRALQFNGYLGELTRSGGSFRAELRGLTDRLNQPLGRVYQKPCAAVLGDTACGVDLTTAGYGVEIAAEQVEDSRMFRFAAIAGFETGWFRRGRLDVTHGAATGLSGVIKNDFAADGRRVIELWAPLRADVSAGDGLQLIAGCDKRLETCRLKFDNIANFQGFPDIPGDDWTVSYPASASVTSGGSRR